MARLSIVAPAAAFVLAGGRSSRMGQDKALLRLDGATLIEQAVAKFRSLGLSPRIAGSRPDLVNFAPVVEDLRPGCGPLGGIEAALTDSDLDLNIFLPVDLPLLPAIFLRWMLSRAELTGATATIPLFQGRPQPLCCVLRRIMLPRISRSLVEGDFKVMPALTAGGDTDFFNVESVAATRREWPSEQPMHRWFQNLNRPEDLLATRARYPQ